MTKSFFVVIASLNFLFFAMNGYNYYSSDVYKMLNPENGLFSEELSQTLNKLPEILDEGLEDVEQFLEDLEEELNDLATNLINTTENIQTFADHAVYQTIKTIPNDDVFTISKLILYGAESEIEHTISIECSQAYVVYCDTITNTWHEIEAEGEMPIEMLYIKTDTKEIILAPAFLYEPSEKTSVVMHNEHTIPIKISKNDNSIDITIAFKNIQGLEGHYYYLISDDVLLDINASNQSVWATHFSLAKQRFLYDGYYYETPSSYTPYSQNMLWRNPATYTPSKFANTGTTQGEYSLSYAMLDIVSNNVEENGTFYTYPESTDFLNYHYGMKSGFYDTRFNTEITKAYLNLYKNTLNPKYLEIVVNSLEFFKYFAETHCYTFESEDGIGILVEDYYHESSIYKKIHSSLNHHIAEINLLYLAYEVIGDAEYLELAEKMIKGVELTQDLWLKEDFSLEYAYSNQGMVFTDYPYLTYNDLIELMQTMNRLGFEQNATLEYLSSHKKIQMDREGITGYNSFIEIDYEY